MCVRVHTHHIRTYILDKNVLSRVLVLMMSSHGHLVLGKAWECVQTCMYVYMLHVNGGQWVCKCVYVHMYVCMYVCVCGPG